MKQNLFFNSGLATSSGSINSERVLRRQGLVLDFSLLYKAPGAVGRGISFIYPVGRAMYRLVSPVFQAFKTVITSPVV